MNGVLGSCSRVMVRRYPFVVHFVWFVIHCSFTYAQPPTREKLTGRWIGVHTELDTDSFCPLPTYIALDPDGKYTLGMVDGSATPIRSTWDVRGDSVRLDTIHYAPGLVRVQDNILRVGTYYPMVFRRFNDVSLDSVSVHRQVAGRVWQSDSLIVSLYANGKVSLDSRTTKQRTVHFWRLSKLHNSVFVVISGNHHDHDGGYKPLWQVVNASSKQLSVMGWTGRNVATETFQFVRALTPGDSCRSSGFQTCSNCFTWMWYASPVGRTQERYDLWQQIIQHYQAVDAVGQSGLIRIRFVVNCAGERGQFEVSGVDDDYQLKRFGTAITDQLIRICRDYIPATFSGYISDVRDNQPQDSAISLTFRLKDGHLTDLLP